MKIVIAKKAPRPIVCTYDQTLKIQRYDIDNLYPQNVRKVAAASKNGMTCLSRYADFIEGNGIHSLNFATLKVNRRNQTLDAINELVANDMALYNGFALHVNYDIACNITEIQHIPFENVRLHEADELGNVTKVVLHPDWTGMVTRNGRQIRVTKENCDYIDVFDPNPEAVAAQIIGCGGIENYKGQVLYYSASGHLTYPTVKYHSVLADMSTDAGLSNVMHRNARNSFMPSGILSHFAERKPENDYIDGEPRDDRDGYFDAIESLQGDENCCKIFEVTVESKDEIPTFTEFPAHNFDKDFTATAEKIEDSIYSVFNQEAFLCIRRGKVGFGGQVIKDAKEEYCQVVRKTQRHITMAYLAIMQRWAMPLVEQPTFDALTIEPIVESVSSIEPAAEGGQNG